MAYNEQNNGDLFNYKLNHITTFEYFDIIYIYAHVVNNNNNT